MIEFKKVKPKSLGRYGNRIKEVVNNKKVNVLYLKAGIYTKYSPEVVNNELYIKTKGHFNTY